jgi:hypothetical protein
MTLDLTRREVLAASAASLLATAPWGTTQATATASNSTLLDSVLRAHGGLEAWKRVKQLNVKLNAKGPVTVDGLVFYKLRRIVPRKTLNPLFSESTVVLMDVADVAISRS